MRHRKKNVGLSRTSSHRRALLANLAGALFTHKKIVTTLSKARVARSYSEKLITFARQGDIAARRQVLKKITDKTVVKELFDVIGPKFRERNGGYTRIIKMDNRPGDNAPMAILELVGFASDDIAPKKKTSRPKKAAAPVADDAPAEAEVIEADVAAEETAAPEAVVEDAVEVPVEEAPAEEAKAEEVVEEAPVKEAPEAPAEEPKAEETPAEEADASEEEKKDE